jgi:methyltransferase
MTLAALAVLLALIFIPMLIETARAAHNERAQLARGGVEPPGDVFEIMRVVYPALFLTMIAEGWSRGVPRREWVILGLIGFAAAKALKWWAIFALGPSWTFRVVVIPGAPLVRHGPYRFLRHPNYVAVALELLGVAAMTGATVSGPLAVVLFSALLRRRIAVESGALAAASRHPPCSL